MAETWWDEYDGGDFPSAENTGFTGGMTGGFPAGTGSLSGMSGIMEGDYRPPPTPEEIEAMKRTPQYQAAEAWRARYDPSLSYTDYERDYWAHDRADVLGNFPADRLFSKPSSAVSPVGGVYAEAPLSGGGTGTPS